MTARLRPGTADDSQLGKYKVPKPSIPLFQLSSEKLLFLKSEDKQILSPRISESGRSSINETSKSAQKAIGQQKYFQGKILKILILITNEKFSFF